MAAVVSPVRAYVGLGSNLADPLEQVRSALQALRGLPATRLTAQSSFYRSAPMGPAGQADYINAAAELSTRLEPGALLRALQAIEDAHGRVRGAVRWGPRTLDLDLLVFGARVITTPQLCVPHPGLHERAFVLYPLQEIAADLVVPGLGRVSALWDQWRATRGITGIERLVGHE